MNNVFIQKSFYEYYANLYKRHVIPLQKIDEHLRKLHLKIAEEQRQIVNVTLNVTGLYITFGG